MIVTILFVLLLSSFFTWFILWSIIPWLRLLLLDYPNNRSSHALPVPRGGGIAIVFVLSFSSAFALLFGPRSTPDYPTFFITCLLALPLALIGFLDDRLNLPAIWRYIVQFITAFFVVSLSPLASAAASFLFVLILVIAVTSVINFTNFMDGLDGLVAGCMSVIITVAGIQQASSWAIWAFVGSLLGFLIWNWSPAKVFMGDVGSTFLGVVFSALVLHSTNWSDAASLVLVATPLMADAFFGVLRRLFARQNIFRAHRLHLFQRLYQAGWPHSRVSVCYIICTALLSVCLLVGGLPWLFTLAVIELFIGLWLDQHVAVPFAVASKS